MPPICRAPACDCPVERDGEACSASCAAASLQLAHDAGCACGHEECSASPTRGQTPASRPAGEVEG